jgi:protease-4
VRTTPLSGEPDILRGPSPEAGQLLQLGVDSTYAKFVSLVAQSRKLPVARVDQIGQGRVWDGGTARQIGLIDQFGTLEDAVADAAKRAKLDPDDAKVVWLEPEPSWLEKLITGVGDAEQPAADVFSRNAAQPQRLIERALADVQEMLGGPAIQARCLECPPGGSARVARGPSSFWTSLAALLLK